MKTRLHTSTVLAVLLVSLLAVGLTALVVPWSPTTLRDDDGVDGATDAQPVQRSAARHFPRDAAPKPVPSVLLISIDGFNPAALKRLGRKKTPHLHKLMRNGASTRNARTMVEKTVTLPNHTSMVTSRRIEASEGGHGVSWNDPTGQVRNVHAAAGSRVPSVFTEVDKAGGNSAVFVSKAKFRLWQRSWPRSINRFRVDENASSLVKTLRADMRNRDRDLRFLHLVAPDKAGHKHGFMGKRYLRSIRRTDALIGRVMKTVKGHPNARGRITVVLTSDHGGTGTNHGVIKDYRNYRVPFVVNGPGIPRNTNLYTLSDELANPGRKQPPYDADKPPVRNGDAGNVVLALLGLDPIPGSEFNARGQIHLRR